MPGQAQRWQTDNVLEQHVILMRRQVERSLVDPSTRMLASAVISGNFDNVVDPRTGQSVPAVPYHGRWYRGAPSWEHAAQLCAARDFACEVRALAAFMISNVRYQADADGEDTYADLRTTLEFGGGDCDDMTIAFAALLKSVGYENVVARIISLDGAEWCHVYPLVQLPTRDKPWICLDITEPSKPFGWQYPNFVAHRDFAL